jgi:hypothetical protein
MSNQEKKAAIGTGVDEATEGKHLPKGPLDHSKDKEQIEANNEALERLKRHANAKAADKASGEP